MFGLFKKKKVVAEDSKKPKLKEELNKEAKIKNKALRRKQEIRGQREEALIRKEQKKNKSKKLAKNIALEHKVAKKEQDDIAIKQNKALVKIKENDLQTELFNQQTKFINALQKKLTLIARLKQPEQSEFEKLYKMAYVINNSRKIPKWLDFYDLLFIGEGHAVIISRFNTSAGPLLRIEEIIKAPLKLEGLTAIFFKLEFIINQLIKLYNEGKNRNAHFKDSIRELKVLGLIEKDLYRKLLFIAEIRSKVGRAWNIAEIKYQTSEGDIVRLKNKELEFKALFAEVYVDIVEIYIKVQEPYLNKFYLLWQEGQLNIGSANSFYCI